MAEIIGKIQANANNYKIKFLYYNRARDALFDVVNELCKRGYRDIYIPGYIGWSPKEGSGIFDPLEAIMTLSRHYYTMDKQLFIVKDNLKEQLKEHSILLVVNYFGFRDPEIKKIIDFAHSKDCVVIEDNAHGFYTYFCYGSVGSDMTIFSLHKLFPFSSGGGMIVESTVPNTLHSIEMPAENYPFIYNYNKIAKIRIDNFCHLTQLVDSRVPHVQPLRSINDLTGCVPQTFPVIVKQGDRDRIYEIMNDAGYGVVSLYHTMVEELQNDGHEDAIWLSQKILNLPIHQDCNSDKYQEMVNVLEKACIETES